MLHQKDTFILVILGSSAMHESQSTNQKNMIKYDNYSLSSYSVLIKRLATNHLGIDKQHVCIFAKGENNDFNIASINPFISVQLTLNEIYKIKISKSELEFTPFRNLDDLFYKMGSYFKNFGDNPNKDIILFMYDHGDEDSFGELNYLKFYLGFLQQIPHSSLQIFNESCKSNSMILKIKRYYTITEIINSGTSYKELSFAAKVASDIYPKGSLKECNELISLENEYYKFFKKEKIPYYFLINSNDHFHEKEINQINDKFRSSFKDKTDLFFKIFESFNKLFPILPHDYTFIHSMFQKGIDAVKNALSKINCTNSGLLIIFKDLTLNGVGFPDILYKKHENHLIVTSSNERGSSPSFGTINAKDIDNANCKIIPGSPAMGAFIIERLMFNSSFLNQSASSIINIKNIENLVYGNDEKLIMEYAVQCPQDQCPSGKSNKKLWIRLNINCWKSNNISEKESSLKADIFDKLKYIQSIMKNIGFTLASKCQIHFSEEGYCTTKKMQPYFENQKRNVIGVRLVNRDQDENYKYDECHFTEDDYYSEDGQSIMHSCSSNNSSQNSSSDDIIPNFSSNILKIDYDMPLNQSYIDIIKKKIKKLDQMYFPEGIFKVFQTELDEIIKYQKIQLKSNQKDQDIIYIRSELNEWTGHFFPTYLLGGKKDELFNLFDEFTNKYQLTHEDIKNIFCRCMDVADQIVTPLKYRRKKTAFFEDRLKTTI
ncbi:hypothetical protein M9Y10_027234 [Tritrichomonas musculus]|uniref:Caspase family p20 domain-containing protein n=1 Tax=Tritrichomonas musculus TaxID=1915356 RepID=A0ABR2H5W7_9EUKA